MKNRERLSNVFSLLIMLMLVVFIISILVDKSMPQLSNILTYISLPVAIFSVTILDIVIPLIYNRKRIKSDKKLLITAIIKSVIFIVAIGVLLIHLLSKIMPDTNESIVKIVNLFSNQFVALSIFIILYFVQFFINLDPKIAKTRDSDKIDDEIVNVENVDEINVTDIEEKDVVEDKNDNE